VIKDKSRGSVATSLNYGGIFNYQFITNSLLCMAMNEFLKLVNIWRSYT